MITYCETNGQFARMSLMAGGVGFRGCFGLFCGAAERNVVALEFAIERGAADAEHFTGESFVAMSLFEDAEDSHFFHFGERGGGERRRILYIRIDVDCLLGAHGGRKVADVDGLAISESDGAGDAVFKFAHVAGPVVLKKALHGRGGELHVEAGDGLYVFDEELVVEWSELRQRHGGRRRRGRGSGAMVLSPKSQMDGIFRAFFLLWIIIISS